MNYTSTENQRIIGKIVNQEIFCNVNQEVEFILGIADRNVPYSHDDIENFYSKIYTEGQYSVDMVNTDDADMFEVNIYTLSSDGELELSDELGKNEALALMERGFELDNLGIDELVEEFTDANPNKVVNDVTPDDDMSEHFDYEEEPQEVLEWWRVTEYFANKLLEKGEVILDGNIWGRQTSGQAILLDYVVGQIAEDMEVLVGQKSSWAEPSPVADIQKEFDYARENHDDSKDYKLIILGTAHETKPISIASYDLHKIEKTFYK